MSDEKKKETEWAEKVISSNREGLRELAEEKPAQRMRESLFYRKLRKAYRKFTSSEEDNVSTIEL
ncbi:hypothetical protein GKQ38_02630 [Candidatus Nanohaloarchaea archaeon]|nr:hypothetical protein GKQ38_02630 [Candidatus Nanohaloarchaea archaeon]